ncbi:MAG: VapC toxin family PIN domain ribonuclease [Bacteroidetes bacterium CG02_land_8_20_14_3_00_31_25]|nr:PIN domain-containing protein [Bacteroidota bacterium]PIV58687.1 MAG: VapC toxin family PIN domain ribonuclease [Bacteroidetes bacterium CG02_land_8_20_14_3_00_31_25]
MNNIFLDSNVCVYAFDKSEPKKQQKAFDLLKENPCLSSQVVIESYNACLKKLELTQKICEEYVLFLTNISRIVEINDKTICSAISIKRKYRFSFLDSMIVASALASNCKILYSEDMQHKQVIEKTLAIINPFI